MTDTTDPARQSSVTVRLLAAEAFKFDDAQAEDRETLVVRDVKSGRRHELDDPQLTEPEMDAVRDEVFRVLGWQ